MGGGGGSQGGGGRDPLPKYTLTAPDGTSAPPCRWAAQPASARTRTPPRPRFHRCPASSAAYTEQRGGGGGWGWGWHRAPRRGASPPNRAERVGTGPEPARPARGGHRLSAAASGGGGGGGEPGGGPRGVPVGWSRGCAGRGGGETPRVSEGRWRGAGGTEGCKTPPKSRIVGAPPPRPRVGQTSRGVAAPPPHPLVSPPARRPPRSHAVGPPPPTPPPRDPNCVPPVRSASTRVPLLPPPPLSDPSVPRVPRSHVAPRPATSGDVSRGGHARPWGPTDRSDATSRSDPAPRSHTAPPPLPHSAFGHERPRAPTDADGHADPRTEPRLPAPLSRSAPRRLQTRGGDTRGPGGGCGGGSRSEPRGATDAQVGPTRTGAARRRCTAAPLPLAPPRAPRFLACPALPALPVPVSVPVSPYR